MEICNYLGGGVWRGMGRVGTPGMDGNTRSSPFPWESIPFPGSTLSGSWVKVPQNPAPWLLPDGGCGGDAVGEPGAPGGGGSAGPPQNCASSLRAEVAVVMDLPCQATLGPCRPLHGRSPATSRESWKISGLQLPLQ